jgi:phage terminase large subunit
VVLVQHHVLAVQDALQAQTADNINFTAAIIIATSRGMYLGMFKGMR